ncbi:MAG: hypothetical protein FWB83_01410 [Treponema sp.]|nr:hypothetical protein [Treponema sp.]
MKKLCFSLFFALMVCAGLAAQARDTTPHVTQIRVESRNNLIRLTWEDSPAAQGPVYIFRSARPFIVSIPANIRPVVVRYGQQYYIDDTDDMENIYYFIAASEVSGRRFDFIIPRVNSTQVNLAGSTDFAEEPQQEVPAIVVHDVPQVETAPVDGISNISAVTDGERVIITFTLTGPRRNAILYRSMQPVRQPHDLLNSVMIRPGVTSPYTDTPVPGAACFYAVIFEDEISSGSMEINPGINATEFAVMISSDRAAERTIRPIPLPILTLRNTLPESFFISDVPVQVPLSAELTSMLRDIRMPSRVPAPQRNPRIFTVDLESPASGEESALFQLLMEYFIRFEWDNARAGLRTYLSLPRTGDTEARARFYLGQALYFTGSYREALMEFLFFKNHYPLEARDWIDSVLEAMIN